MKVPPLLALFGMLFAAIVAEFNDQVTGLALADVGGGLGFGGDAGSWVSSLYVSAQIIGMCIAPSLSLVFSLRRFGLFAIALSCVSTLLVPLCDGVAPLLILRVLQGLAAGFSIPLLMTLALRVLPPPVRLYGLAVYALSATFVPNLSATMAALWTDGLEDWRFVFLEALPLCSIAAVLVWFGAPQDPMQYGRLRSFDWIGVALMAVGFSCFSTMLLQGNRFDWFNSPVMGVLALASVIVLPLFFINEWFHPQPLIKLQMLQRRNFAFGIICLFGVLIIALASSEVPLAYLEEVQGYRPLQAHLLTLEVALLQLVLLPATAKLLDNERLDARWVSATGMACILFVCLYYSRLSGDWNREQFFLVQAVAAVGLSFIVMPLLMMATNEVKPPEAPFASALVNTPRAIAETVGIWLIALIGHWRGSLHASRILDQIGQSGTFRSGGGQGEGSGGGFGEIAEAVQQQVAVLTFADTFLILAGIVVVLMIVLATLPVRPFPPRIALAKH